MAAITLDLPDHLVTALTRRASDLGSTVSELVREALEGLANDALEPLELTSEELEGLVRAQADIAAGRVRDHAEVMARFDAIVDR